MGVLGADVRRGCSRCSAPCTLGRLGVAVELAGDLEQAAVDRAGLLRVGDRGLAAVAADPHRGGLGGGVAQHLVDGRRRPAASRRWPRSRWSPGWRTGHPAGSAARRRAGSCWSSPTGCWTAGRRRSGCRGVSAELVRLVRTSEIVSLGAGQHHVDLTDQLDGPPLQVELVGVGRVEGGVDERAHRRVGHQAGLDAEVDRRDVEVLGVEDQAELRGGASGSAGRAARPTGRWSRRRR